MHRKLYKSKRKRCAYTVHLGHERPDDAILSKRTVQGGMSERKTYRIRRIGTYFPL